MAQSRDYLIKLYPAHKDGGFVVTKFSITATYPQKQVQAAGMVDLVEQITQYAMEYGDGCQASVRCLAKRNPPGFKKATKGLYFNLKEGSIIDDVGAAPAPPNPPNQNSGPPWGIVCHFSYQG